MNASSVRRAIGSAPDRFGVALVGKGRGVKLRRQTPITLDAMPMRQLEMKARDGRSEP